MLGDFKIAQIMSIALGIVGLVMILAQAKKPKLEALYNDKTAIENITF